MTPRSSWVYPKLSVLPRFPDKRFISPWADADVHSTHWADREGLRDYKAGCDTLKSNWTDGEDPRLNVVNAEISKSPGEASDMPGSPCVKGQPSRFPCKDRQWSPAP